MQKERYKFPMAKAIHRLYLQGEDDETMCPIAFFDSPNDMPIGRFEDGDYVIFYDIRGEREVEITEALTDLHFSHFPTKKMKLNFVTMIEYDPKLNTKVAFSRAHTVSNTLSEVVSKAGLHQIKIVESEKEVHLTYFLNGKNQKPFPNEERVIIDSPKVHEFDSIPEMNVAEVADKVMQKIEEQKYDLIVSNFCNIDVVGHTENEKAIIRAIKAVDDKVGEVVALAQKRGMRIIITADHGTVEKRYFPEGTVDTGHTDSKVPFIFIDSDCDTKNYLAEDGALTDIAPTILKLIGIEKPEEMTGNSLLTDYEPKIKKPVLLLILDGWGYREESYGNLIKQANPTNMNRIMQENSFITIYAAGEYVGMPDGTVGNSEAGHLHIGAGRVVLSDRLKIDNSIKDGSFYENKTFKWAVEGAKKDKTNLHLLGIVSFYSSHGSLHHLFALMDMAKKYGVKNMYIHSMLGRRGERPESGAHYIEEVEEKCAQLELGKVVSVIGRKWAMDREHNWDRIEKAYRLFVYGDGDKAILHDSGRKG
ncbi:MAG: alkaline phosphatase family protein [Candidatus Cloacimonadota bacterium]|nr:alkaline phosphatase family protein [Candidatus Cloacimonadota bacterium]